MAGETALRQYPVCDHVIQNLRMLAVPSVDTYVEFYPDVLLVHVVRMSELARRYGAQVRCVEQVKILLLSVMKLTMSSGVMESVKYSSKQSLTLHFFHLLQNSTRPMSIEKGA